MELIHLEAFLAAADTGSFRRAAEMLFLSQSGSFYHLLISESTLETPSTKEIPDQNLRSSSLLI